MRKHGGTPFWRDKHVTPAAISPPGVARGHFVGGQQSGLAGCKPPPLFTRGASYCSSRGQGQREPWGKKQTTGAGNDANKRQSTTAHHHTTAQRNRTQHRAAEHQDTPRRTTGRRATRPDKDSTTEARHQDPPGDSRGRPGPPANTTHHQPAHTEQRQGQHHRGTRGHTRQPKTHKPAPHRTTGEKKEKKTEKGKTRNKGNKKGGGA